MNKSDFLEKNDVKCFVDWLSNKISHVPLNISIKRSKFVPNGLDYSTNRLEVICEKYQWNASWTNRFGHPESSSDWQTTKQSLSNLRGWLNQAVNNNDDNDLYNAACAVLDWGGVRSAKLFLEGLRNKNRLVTYLSAMRQAMTLETACLDVLNPDLVLRFDSGLTKIHAFLSDDGLPIYDSRVAAAIAAFVYLYKLETGKDIDHLKFPVSEARGNQIRNLRGFSGGNVFPRLYSNASHSDWAKAQVKLGWIIEEVLNNNPNLFAKEGTLPNRMHAFEACLFMIGYDLRCLRDLFTSEVNEIADTVVVPNHQRNAILTLWNQPFSGSKVPTSHNFATVISYYKDFRQNNPANSDLKHFKDWLKVNVKSKNKSEFKKTTVSAYCYPLGYNEMSIRQLSDGEINRLADDPTGELSKAFLEQWKGCDIDEALPNCIADVFIVGQIANMALKGHAAANQIVMYGFAGTPNAAQAILSVGRSVGRHFGFLDEKNSPTELYQQYFS